MAHMAWDALRPYDEFLFRHLGDQQRCFLFVGEAEVAHYPRTTENGLVDTWWYGHLSYEARHRTEQLPARYGDAFNYLPSHWAVPRWVLEWDASGGMLHTLEAHEQEALRFCDLFFRPAGDLGPLPFDMHWSMRTPRDRYLQRSSALLDHIQRGDIYEVNYCTERWALAPRFDPFNAFDAIWSRARPRFAAFHRAGDRFALSASPERFLAFEGSRVVGQPMKGTRSRGVTPEEDLKNARSLATDAKERSENIMALDVMRNDLSRVAASRSVMVEELCAVHPYPHVHQMISTVSASVAKGLSPVHVLQAAFPMASMTGAPKVRAMELIDQYEDQARGLFSGSLGYFAPDGTGDLNVVIRTLLHHAGTGLTSLSTGSALTALADPVQEWEECMLKARSVLDLLRQ